MPDEETWNSFFGPEKIIDRMGINRAITDAADFGCGYGTFTIPAAKVISGKIYAIDIDPSMVERVSQRAHGEGLGNIVAVVRDLMDQGSGLEDGSIDYVMLFNILHAENPQVLLDEAFRVLKPGGELGIINWIRDASTPRGPPLEIRPTIEQCISWCIRAGFRADSVETVDLKPYHYGLIMGK